MEKEEAIEEFLDYEEEYDYEEPKKKGLISFFKTILGFNEEGEEEVIVEKNEFSEFLEDIPDFISDEVYNNVYDITVLCTRSINIITQKMRTLSNSRSIERELHNTKYIADLSDEDVVKLKKQMDLFLNLSQENTRLMYKVTSFNRAISELQGRTELAVKALPEIEHSEKQQKMLKADIYLIEQERSEIFEEYDNMKYGIELIDKASIISLLIFSVITLFLMYLNVFVRVGVFYYIATVMSLLIIVVGGMFVAKLRLKRGIKINLKKQARAVEILNKKNAVLAHHTNYLNYEYKKFNAQNSANLRSNLKEFEEYKIVANRKTATRRALEEAEAEIKDFFKDRGKSIPNISVEKFVSMIDIENKKMHYDRLILERVKVEEDVERLDLEQEKIWEKIEYLQTTTGSQRMLINDILKAYYARLDKIMNNYKEVFENIHKNNVEQEDDKEIRKDRQFE